MSAPDAATVAPPNESSIEPLVDEAVDTPRALRILVGVLVAVTVIMGQIGAALAPKLVVDHPLTMLILSSNTRYLLLVSNQLGGLEYFAVALLRRSIPITLCFVVGYWYGPRALGRFGRRAASGRGIAPRLERSFQRASWVMVILAPVVFVAILAGVARLQPRRALGLMYASIAVRLVAYRILAEQATAPIDSILAWIRQWQMGLIVLSVTAVLVTAWSHRRRGTVLEEIEDDLLAPPVTECVPTVKTTEGVTTEVVTPSPDRI